MDEASAQSLLALAERSRSELVGLEAGVPLRELDEAYAALREAFAWFLHEGHTQEAMRLAIALAPFWMASKRLRDGADWFQEALEAPGEAHAIRGRAFYEAGLISLWLGRDRHSKQCHEAALDLGRRADDPTVTALALGGLARLALRSANVSEARRLCLEALEVTEGSNDRIGRSGAMHVLGVAAQMAEDFEEARTWMKDRLALMRELGNYAGISSEAGNLSMVERQLGNLDAAEALAREALEIDFQRGDAWAIPYKLNGLLAVAVARRRFSYAATLAGAAESMLEAQGAAWPPDERPHFEKSLGALEIALGSDALEEARGRGRAMSTAEAVAFALDASGTSG